jgi:hypothetical protein
MDKTVLECTSMRVHACTLILLHIKRIHFCLLKSFAAPSVAYSKMVSKARLKRFKGMFS